MKDVIEVFSSLQNTPVPNILVLLGAVLILLAFVGKIGAMIELNGGRQLFAGIVGIISLSLGIFMYLTPSPNAQSSNPLQQTNINTPVVPTIEIVDKQLSSPNFEDHFPSGVDCKIWHCKKGNWITSDGQARPSQGTAIMTIGTSSWNSYTVDFDFIFSPTPESANGTFILFASKGPIHDPSYVYLNLFLCPSGVAETKYQKQACFDGNIQIKGSTAILGQINPNTPFYLKDTEGKVLRVEPAFELDTTTHIQLKINGSMVTVKINGKIFFDNEELAVDRTIWPDLSGEIGFEADSPGFSFDNLIIKPLGT